MTDINNMLSNLNNGYEQITNLIPDKQIFIDDFSYAKNEYDQLVDGDPLGSQLYVLSNGKYVWVGIDGSEGSNGYKNVRRYNSDFTLDETFVCPYFSGNDSGSVRSVIEQSNGKLIVVGHFNNVGGNPQEKIVRLNTDGTVDSSFTIGTGFNGNAFVIKVLSDDSVLVGGVFNAYNGVSVHKLVKLSSNGVLDTSFNNNATAVNNQVHSIHVDSAGKIYVGGNLTNRLVRLNSDGTTDSAFDVGSGFDDRVSCISENSDGKIFVGGWFNSYKGVSCNPGIVRLETNGDLDSTFETEGSGLNRPEGIVQTLFVQNDNKIIVAGWFNEYNGGRQGHIIRFNTNGTKDTSFNTAYGFLDSNNNWGSRIQSVIVHNNEVLCVGGISGYNGNALYGFAKLSLTGDLSSEKLFKYKTYGIRDGWNDMYDGGNFINTNLTQSFDEIVNNGIDEGMSIRNTHSTALDKDPFENEEENVTFIPSMDGQAIAGDDYFGSGSSYFTNMYPGMFTLVATNINIEEFSISGNLGSGGATQNQSSMIVVHEGSNYTVFVKVSREGDGSENGDPSVNHIIIVPGEPDGLTHFINESGDDDDDCVKGLADRKSIAYILVARSVSDYLSDSDAEAIALKFLDIAGGLSSVKSYTYDFSPQQPSYYGEGGLDTAIIIENGTRRSIQRTGYFELVNANGGRKVVEVKDGETVSDEVEIPTYNLPTGNPLVQ